MATTVLVADDATGIGVADDLLIPFVIGCTLIIAAGVQVYEAFTDKGETVIPYAMEIDVVATQENYTPIYRWGSGTATNLTPRESDIAGGWHQVNILLHIWKQ